MTEDNGIKANSRLTKITDFVTLNKTATTIPFDPDSTRFPLRKELQTLKGAVAGAPVGAAWVWGTDDNLGRLNLLTPSRVSTAGKEIRSGEIINLNLPLNVPAVPAFGREPFKHTIKTLTAGLGYDDLYSLNTQSGTQWDGFRHMAKITDAVFYNGTLGKDIEGPEANMKCSIHHWADHGIAGRGVLLDFRTYAKNTGIKYDPYNHYEITYSALEACGQSQGLDIRPAAQGGDIQIGDILLVRSGFIEAYNSKSVEERKKGALRSHSFGPEDGQRWTGLSQEEEIVDWLHDSYFAAVAGDAPAFEAWPSMQGRSYLHEHILALWGMPLGEMFDLEKLAETCRLKNRWTFFFTSAPANCPGGVSSHANAQAIF